MSFSLAAVGVGEHLYWNIGGLTCHGETLIVFWFVMAFLFGISFGIWYRHLNNNLLIPSGGQNFFEVVFLYILGIVRGQLGPYHYRPWFPLIATLFLFIFLSDFFGVIIPWKIVPLSEGELGAATGDINCTVGLSLITSISYFYAGCKIKGVGFFARYISPSLLFLPLNILEDFSKPLSLSFRLFGNIVADEIVVSVLCLLVPLFVPLPVMILGLFAGSVQALVFATLASCYIAESIE